MTSSIALGELRLVAEPRHPGAIDCREVYVYACHASGRRFIDFYMPTHEWMSLVRVAEVVEAAKAWAKDEDLDDFPLHNALAYTPTEKRLLIAVMQMLGMNVSQAALDSLAAAQEKT